MVMSREFPDELLSALIDDKLAPEERALVEQHLANNEADRQLLTELRSLRGDLKSLPQVSVAPDFADRVVRAALAAAHSLPPAEDKAVVVVKPAAASGRHYRSWAAGVAVVATALAAGLLMFFQPWGESSPNPGQGTVAVGQKKADASPTDDSPVNASAGSSSVESQIAAALRQAAAAEGDVIVLRLELGGEQSVDEALNAALAKAGIAALPGDAPPVDYAPSLIRSYRQQLAQKNVTPDATVPAAEALLIEAPLDRLQAAFMDLASAAKRPLEIRAAARIGLPKAEGEFDRERTQQTFAQRLKADMFRLEKTAGNSVRAGGAAAAPALPVAKLPVRVLILVERK
jgi:anti-sigma factor RsiW